MKIVLHICCGVCAAGVVERLSLEGHEVFGFFCNPNIHPEEEYQRRLKAVNEVARELNFPLTVAPYLPEDWFREVSGLENEPEGVRRCEVCFRTRLVKTYLFMKESGGDVFTTTLTISSHKSADVVNRVGREVGVDAFLAKDFKKKEGFRRAVELSKMWSLYRQNYCGCIYSLRDKGK